MQQHNQYTVDHELIIISVFIQIYIIPWKSGWFLSVLGKQNWLEGSESIETYWDVEGSAFQGQIHLHTKLHVAWKSAPCRSSKQLICFCMSVMLESVCPFVCLFVCCLIRFELFSLVWYLQCSNNQSNANIHVYTMWPPVVWCDIVQQTMKYCDVLHCRVCAVVQQSTCLPLPLSMRVDIHWNVISVYSLIHWTYITLKNHRYRSISK